MGNGMPASTNVFPLGHVCPLAVERNESRCADPAGKPDAACIACREELIGELGYAMLEGDASFFDMLFAGHALGEEGFAAEPDDDGGIRLMRAQEGSRGLPGDCAVDAIAPEFGGGFRLFVAVDDDHEIVEILESLDDAARRYFDCRDAIGELARGSSAEIEKPQAFKRRTPSPRHRR